MTLLGGAFDVDFGQGLVFIFSFFFLRSVFGLAVCVSIFATA